MVNVIKSRDPRRLNKGHCSNFREGSRVRQETPEEGKWTYKPKLYEYENKDKDNIPKIFNDKNHVASFQKFCQLVLYKTKNNYFISVFNLRFVGVLIIFSFLIM